MVATGWERQRLVVPVDGRKVTAVTAMPPGGIEDATGVIVLAHGAGNDMDHPLLHTMAEGLASRGFMTVRFNFPYREAGRKAPDPPRRLEATWLAVTDELRERLEGRKLPFILGGKSLGGRVAAQLATDGVIEPAGLMFFGYPLHVAGEEEQLRDAPLRGATAAMLFVTGSKDRLCRVDLLQKVCTGLSARAEIHVVTGGDHDLDVRDRPRSAVYGEVLDVCTAWLRHSLRGRASRRSLKPGS